MRITLNALIKAAGMETLQELERLLETTRARVAQATEAQHRVGRYLDYYQVQAEVFTSKAAAASSPDLKARYLRLAASHERLAKLAADMAAAQPGPNSAAAVMVPERSHDLVTEAARQHQRVEALLDRLPTDERDVALAARVEFSDKLCVVSEAIIDQSRSYRNGK